MTTVAVETLGCAKNLVDSERILGYLREYGLQPVDDLSRADIIIVNTCGFITPAKEESINTILELALYKQQGNCRLLLVTGCMAGKYGEELLEEMPEIDAVAENADLDGILRLIREKMPVREVKVRDFTRLSQTGKYVRYLKIADGCNNNCTYCTIPELTGHYKSVDMEQLVREAEILIREGARELNLVAQDVTRYGVDLYGRHALAELVERLANIEGDFWIRLLYCYPTEFTPELIEVIAREDKVCNYLDIPLQHVADSVLRRMGRKGSKKQILKLIDTLRAKIPDVTIRSTFIVGFPGETEEEFMELLDFLETVKLDWVGAFTYWPEPDTPAAAYPGQISQQVKEERYHRLIEVQRRITLAKNNSLVGKKIPVLIEGTSPDYPEYKVGRSARQAAEVDGITYVKTDADAGHFIVAHITDTLDDYDLIGEDSREPGQ